MGAIALVKMMGMLHSPACPGPSHASVQDCGTIQLLEPFLEAGRPAEGAAQALAALDNLCKISRTRQEAAAVSGVVPHLVRLAAPLVSRLLLHIPAESFKLLCLSHTHGEPLSIVQAECTRKHRDRPLPPRAGWKHRGEAAGAGGANAVRDEECGLVALFEADLLPLCCPHRTGCREGER